MKNVKNAKNAKNAKKREKTRKTRKNAKKRQNHTKSLLLVYIEAGFAGFTICADHYITVSFTLKIVSLLKII